MKTEKGKSVRQVRQEKIEARKLAESSGSPAEQLEAAQTKWPWPLRPYQQEAHKNFKAGLDRQQLVWHRRAGKDIYGMSLAKDEMCERIGNYVHFFPKHIQARRAIWNGIDPRKGRKLIDIAFEEIEVDRNNTEMLIEAANGATWQLLGSDSYDRVVGGNLVGVVFSEWALCDPRAWDYIRPMLLENKGWALFISTYRGRNHCWQMFQQVKNNPKWYCQELTVEDTTDVNGNRIITDQDIQDERDSGMSESMIQQEYFCNPDATAEGAVYGQEVDALRNDVGRLFAQYDSAMPVYCVWQLDIPITASYILVQGGNTGLGLKPRVLAAKHIKGTTLNDAIADATSHSFPIAQHMVQADQAPYVQHFADLGLWPQLVGAQDAMPVIHTSNFINRLEVNLDLAGELLDAIAGYVRKERFDSQAADLQFSDEPTRSWHQHLVGPLEKFATWEYHCGKGWGEPADYSQVNRAARVTG